MYEWLESFLKTEYIWMAEVFAIVFAIGVATLIAVLAVGVTLSRLLVKAQKTKNVWDDAIIESSMLPVKWMTVLIGLCWALEIVGERFDIALFGVVNLAREVGVILLLCWLLVRLVTRVENNLLDPDYMTRPMDKTTVTATGKLLRAVALITSIIVIMQTLGYSVSGILAFGGIGGLAVGFAAKDLLANFFGGLMIYLDRPFKVGDWIRSPDKEIEGTVEMIGWRLTKIRTFDKRPLYIPNSTFTSISVENPSRMLNRRIFETVGIRYADADKMNGIIQNVKAMLLEHPEIDTSQTLIVNFNTFAPSSLDFFIYTFTKTTEWVKFHEIKQDVLLKLLEIIEQQGAQCAFPTSTVHLPDLAKSVTTLMQKGQHSTVAAGE